MKWLDDLKERISSRTISENWKRVRDVAVVVTSVGGVILSISTVVTLPVIVVSVVSKTTLIASIISGRAQLNKTKI